MKTLPAAWIDRIFAQLSAMYGSKFASMWADSNPQAVKAIWAEKLGGFLDTPMAIKEALDSFDTEPWPPTLPEFLNACRTAAKRIPSQALALPEPISTTAAVAILAEAHKRAGISPRRSGYDFKLWAKKHRTDYQAGVCLTHTQIQMASEALGEIWDNGVCEPKRVAA